MKLRAAEFLAPTLVALGLAGATMIFALEARSFRAALVENALRDLETRTSTATLALTESLSTGDFRKIREFGAKCTAEGLRFTVLSAPGGMIFDTARNDADFPDAIYSSRKCGDFFVRLGLPTDRALVPFNRARLGFLLAAAVGGAGVLLVFLFTYRQRMRMEEMRKLEHFRRDFISDVSHELKTPLTGILGAVELLGEGKLQDMIRKESLRLNDLVQGILSLSRLEREACRDTLNIGTFDLAEVAKDSVERFLPAIANQPLKLSFEPADGETLVQGDAVLVSQALANLVSNAIRHSAARRITVKVEVKAKRAMVTVDDDGIGISKDDRKRIFERFYRVDSSRTASTGGSGLGLAIARRIFRVLGGDVELIDKEGSGCRFVAWLPNE